ncbi:MAG: hypothetical protein HY589_02485 [Candidatus Omnitrophica bacterium]|nr:hypothetical protein [Candidatus Omnitrophota bacterium]
MRAKRATALFLVQVVMIIVGLGTTAILQMMTSYAGMRVTTAENAKAWYLAEAGVQCGIARLRIGRTLPYTITTEEYSITIDKTQQADGSWKVKSSVSY